MKFINCPLLERNIVNVKEIALFLDVNICQYGNTTGQIRKWIKSNLKNYILREYDNVSVISDPTKAKIISTSGDINAWTWAKKALDNDEFLYKVNIPLSFQSTIYHVLDYFRANPNLDISRMSVPEAIRQSKEWTVKLNTKASSREDVQGTQEVRKYPDGFCWVKVTSEQALGREGKLMKHCVGSYCDRVCSGSTSIYSLRDKKNEPHCTIELRQGNIDQIKGKANGPVNDKYVKYVNDFVLEPITEEKYSIVSDLKNSGLIEIEDKIYSINNLPSGLKVKGNLRLYDRTSLITLPEDLEVGKDLYLHGCTSLTILPKNLKVGRDLSLNRCISLTTLLSGLEVGCGLYLGGCTSLTTLPEDLRVGGDLNLSYCTSLTALPSSLKVGGCIWVSDNMKKYFKDSKFKDKIK